MSVEAPLSLSSPGALSLGPFTLTETVLVTWGLMLLLAVLGGLLGHLGTAPEGRRRTLAEALVAGLESAVAEVLPAAAVRRILPFVATLWLFILAANLIGLVPGLDSPTRDLSATAALALLVFASTHWYGIRARGWRAYLRHYAEPSPLLLPFHLISELTRTLALAIRLFGNMMSLEMAALLVLLIAGFLLPVPLLMLHVVEAVVQAYIFGMLALIYIASAIEPGESPENSAEPPPEHPPEEKESP